MAKGDGICDDIYTSMQRWGAFDGHPLLDEDGLKLLDNLWDRSQVLLALQHPVDRTELPRLFRPFVLSDADRIEEQAELTFADVIDMHLHDRLLNENQIDEPPYSAVLHIMRRAMDEKRMFVRDTVRTVATAFVEPFLQRPVIYATQEGAKEMEQALAPYRAVFTPAQNNTGRIFVLN